MERRQPPQTEEGWYVLHDFRSIDWDAWRAAPERERMRAIESGTEYLSACEAVTDAEDGDSATFSVLGHKADLLVLHLRPTLGEIDTLERQFERTALADFTERADSYLSVTEVSGYMSQEFFDDAEMADTGMERYIESRLKPEIPDTEFLSFYPMSKRRGPDHNWYELPFDERAEYLSAHGEIGKGYAGRVTQIISGSIGLDDYEWGITLFGDDPTDVKELLYEMRFDPSSSRFAEFGRFLSARRFPPAQLGAFLAGEPVPQDEAESHHAHGTAAEHGGHSQAESAAHGGSSGQSHDNATDDDVRSELDDIGVYAGQPHGEDVHAVVLYSAADPDDLFEEVEGLRTNFDHYDTHVKTAVYASRDEDSETAIVSLWETDRAANTAASFLADLPEIVRQAGDDTDESWGTMGMFYTVKPEHRTDFVDTFGDVAGILADMEGHRKTDLLKNLEDENDMFIASRWDSREDAMQFFRSEEFSETVEFGRDVLVERPRHVFLA